MNFSLDQLKQMFNRDGELDMSEFTFDNLTILTEAEMKKLYESGAKTTNEIREGNKKPAK